MVGSKTTPSVTTRVGGRTFQLDYEYEFGSDPNAVMGRHQWRGTVKEGTQVVGGFARNLISGTTYSLDMTLGATTHSTRIVQSYPWPPPGYRAPSTVKVKPRQPV